VGLWFNGISMGYLYLLMGVLISAAVIPATLTLLWDGQNKWAAMLSPVFGTACAITAWLVTSKKSCGTLTVECTGSNTPMLAGNVTALFAPLLCISVCTIVFGFDKYNWKSMGLIRQADDHEMIVESGLDEEAQREAEHRVRLSQEEEEQKLSRAFKISVTVTAIL